MKQQITADNTLPIATKCPVIEMSFGEEDYIRIVCTEEVLVRIDGREVICEPEPMGNNWIRFYEK